MVELPIISGASVAYPYMHAAARVCRLLERPLQGACVPLMVARALRVHLTRREGAEGGTPLQARPTHSCSTACELRARRWLLAPEGGQAQRRVRPPTPRCAHGALRSTRAAGPPDVSPPRPPDERDNRSGRHTYGGTAPSRQAGVSSTACTSAITQPRSYRRCPRRRLLRP